MIYTDDPHRDFLRYEEEMEEKLKERPVCDECGEPIRSDTLVALYGVLLCEDCIEEHRHSVEEYME